MYILTKHALFIQRTACNSSLNVNKVLLALHNILLNIYTHTRTQKYEKTTAANVFVFTLAVSFCAPGMILKLEKFEQFCTVVNRPIYDFSYFVIF